MWAGRWVVCLRTGKANSVLGALSLTGTKNQRTVSPLSSFPAPEAQRETVFVCASCNQTLSK